MKPYKQVRFFTILITITAIVLILAGLKLLDNLAVEKIKLPTVSLFRIDDNEVIKGSIREAIESQKEEAVVYLIHETEIDNIQISKDGKWAVAWLIPIDPETGQPVPAEPGLAILNLEDSGWKVTLPHNPEWMAVLLEIPDDLLPNELRAHWVDTGRYQIEATAGLGPYGGYYLPWAGGETLYLTQSVKHDAYTPNGNAHYAFDFAKPGYPSAMFNVHAAKGGTVYKAAWSYSNGNPASSNLLVLEDTTTEPTTYQLYMHLAKDSIPPEFRIKGRYVGQGQFIGVADDTGVSTGNHLHFHVHTNPASYWGRSVDITFEDVLINGGRPRYNGDLRYCKNDSVFQDICDETSYSYTSRNYPNPDYVPPTGDITSPVNASIITTDTLKLEGWASDEGTGIKSVQFIAKYLDEWFPVSEVFTSTNFTFNWNLCQDRIPDGPVSIALDIEDNFLNKAHGLPGLRHIFKEYGCPPITPDCEPSDSEIALFSDPDFTGRCVILGVGDYTQTSNLGDVGDNNAESIIVGENVLPTLFMDDDMTGRGETFTNSDSNLSDNRIGSNNISSLKVQSRAATPRVPLLISPNYSAVYNSDDSISFSWENLGAGIEFQARINLNESSYLNSPWLTSPDWQISSLPTGRHTWQVRSRNENTTSGWSSFRYFYIQSSDVDVVNESAPFADNMEGSVQNWSNSLNWAKTNEENHTLGGTFSYKYDVGAGGSYDNGSPNSGYLTSPMIQIPGNSEYFLRFWYRYETEINFQHWDQRWVQVSVDGAPFENIHQLLDDNPDQWLQSPAIPLSDYSGETIRIRFYFNTLDAEFNHFKGWYIDDVSITETSPPDCVDAGNTALFAEQIKYGDLVNGSICPGGDIDFYTFYGNRGDRVGAVVDTASSVSPLETVLYLLDSDGSSIIADSGERPVSDVWSSLLSYNLTKDGNYFLKVKAKNHPSEGSEDSDYILKLVNDNEKPTISFINPQEGQEISPGPLTLQVDAGDTISGISYVDFYWLPPNDETSSWTLIGQDRDGTDGWSQIIELPDSPNLPDIVFYVRAYDWAGNGSSVIFPGTVNKLLYFPIVGGNNE